MQDYIPRKIDINSKIADVVVKQYDHLSRYLHLQIMDVDVDDNGNRKTNGSEPLNIVGCKARMYIDLGSEGCAYIDGEVADGEEGIITFLLPNGTTQTAGNYQAEIWISNPNDSSQISTKTFTVVVNESIRDDEAIEATEKFSALQNALNTVDSLEARMDTLTSLPNGSTTGDAELADVRVGSDGTVYPNAGTAVRTIGTKVINLTEAVARKENYYSYMVGDTADFSALPEPISREDKYLYRMCQSSGNHGKTWSDIRNDVRLGIGAALYPVGYEFVTPDANTGLKIVWVVRGHDHHTPANSRLTHSMTLETKYVYSNANGSYKSLQLDAPEALFYAEDGLAAGTYHFTVANQAWYAADNGKTFQFTLAQAVPAGGQVVVSATYNQTLEGKSVRIYASPSSTTAIETITLTEGSTGADLGTTNGAGNVNHFSRVVFGSNNYEQSAARQWLNSNAAAGSVWIPQTKYDRPPSWAKTYNGFMHGLPADFLEVVEPAVIPCRTNGVFECASLDGTEFTINQVYELKDKFFLLSRPEIYGSWDSTTHKDGELLDYYDGLTNAERKKYDNGGTVRYAWLRSPGPSGAGRARVVSAGGSLNDGGAYDSVGVAPACIIA